MKQDNRQTQLILCLFGIFPVVWLGLLISFLYSYDFSLSKNTNIKHDEFLMTFLYILNLPNSTIKFSLSTTANFHGCPFFPEGA